VKGKTLTTRWGREGSDGTTKSTPFSTAAHAEKEAEKQIRAKKRKGYS